MQITPLATPRQATSPSGKNIISPAWGSRNRHRQARRSDGSWLTLGIAACLTILLSGCFIPQTQPDPTRFYLLEPQADQNGQPNGERAEKAQIRIGLRKLRLPGYLRRPAIAIQTGGNGHQLQYAEYQRWAEPLETNLQRVLRLNFGSHPAVRSAKVEPFRSGSDLDYIVSIEIQACEGVRPGTGHPGIRFAAQWRVMSQREDGPNEDQEVASGTFKATSQKWDGDDFASLAHRLSRAAATLTNQIVTELMSR